MFNFEKKHPLINFPHHTSNDIFETLIVNGESKHTFDLLTKLLTKCIIQIILEVGRHFFETLDSSTLITKQKGIASSYMSYCFMVIIACTYGYTFNV